MTGEVGERWREKAITGTTWGAVTGPTWEIVGIIEDGDSAESDVASHYALSGPGPCRSMRYVNGAEFAEKWERV